MSGSMDTDSYTIVMAMCERLGSSEAALALREDMRSQGLEMEDRCCLHLVTTLIADDKAGEAVEVMRGEWLQTGTCFLPVVAKQLLDNKHPALALEACSLTSDPSHPLLCVQLECLGSLGQVEEMQQLLEEVSVGVESDSLQVAFVNGLSLAGLHHRAMEHLSSLKCIASPRTLCLLLEATRRGEDVGSAAAVFHTLWEQTFTLKDLSVQFLQTSVSAAEEDRSSYLLRAANACLHLQALALRDTASEHSEAEEQFLSYDFPSFLHQQSVYPDQHTYATLLLRLCFDEGSLDTADRAIKSLFQCGSPLTSEAFVEWAGHCGPITPQQANRVLGLIRRNFRARYDIRLTLEDYVRLLGVELVCGGDPKQLTHSFSYIRTIKNTMSNQGLLTETSHWYPIISALATLGPVGGPLFITYDDMLTCGVEPDLHMYKIIASAAQTNSTTAHSAAVDWWRMLNSRVKPDVELMNTLIRCCEVCGEWERGFLFLGLFEQCQLSPDMDTFDALFKICDATRDHDRLMALSSLAETILPQQRDHVRDEVQRIHNNWTDSEQHHSESE
ncbi:uncharacterized protein LOC135334810 isoform X3 [Halichondria panicea]